MHLSARSLQWSGLLRSVPFRSTLNRSLLLLRVDHTSSVPLSSLLLLGYSRPYAIKAVQDPQPIFVLLPPPCNQECLKSTRACLQLSSRLYSTIVRRRQSSAPLMTRPFLPMSTSTRAEMSSLFKRLRSPANFMTQMCMKEPSALTLLPTDTRSMPRSDPFPVDPNVAEETHQLTIRALVVGSILGGIGR